MDRNRAVTAEDLIRRYDLENLKVVKNKVNVMQKALENQHTIIKQYIQNVTRYSNQVDTTTWFYNGTPTLENEPYISFDQNNLSNYINNIYYDRDTGKAYKFICDDDEYDWEEIQDTSLIQSLAIASSEADSQDNKRKTFYEFPTTPYDVGDIWINGNLIMRCRCSRESGNYSDSDWVEQQYYDDSSVLLDVKAILNQFEELVTNEYATRANLETTSDNIMAQVSSSTAKITNDLTGLINSTSQTYSAQLEIESASINASLDSMRETASTYNDTTNSRIDQIHNYLNYQLEIIDGQEVGVVTLGASNSDMQLKLVNNIIYFEQSGNRVAYISNNKLYITDSEFLNSLKIGNFSFVPRSNGSLGFRKVVL